MKTRRSLGMADPPTGRVVTGTYLRYLREANKLTAAEVHGRAHMSHSDLSRVESGGRALALSEAAMLLAGRYGISEADFEGVVRFISETEWYVKERFPSPYPYVAVDGHQGWEDRLAAVEQRADAARFFSTWLVPTFLRIPGYPNALTGLRAGAHRIPRPEGIGAGGAMVVLEKSVLARAWRGPVFADQILHLITAVDQGRIRLRILPLDAQLNPLPAALTEYVLPGGMVLYATEEAESTTYQSGLAAESRFGGFLDRAVDASVAEAESRELLLDARKAVLDGTPPSHFLS
ncbi:Scr1 family TA system antitoxin-like transcriptional regulator [Streptomyces sp. NPDC015032]|uniref:Scr1 family TA system antitoxin-like transcriptional regulator n=1 Tax=Streptomyces sp. NPDC015032 TaxID=3364937 RepID=UPI0037017781